MMGKINQKKEAKMIKLIIGDTGTGKTYKAITGAAQLGYFAYIGPCRQLVYETAIRYGNSKDTISTGEVHLEGFNNYFGVFESTIDYRSYKTLIIDECHFLTDEERGGELNLKIKEAKQAGLNVILVTGTLNFEPKKSWKVEKLSPLANFTKEEISLKEFYQRMAAGVPSIIFRRYKSDCGNNAITADTPSYERVKTQMDFMMGNITCVEATNAIAQGVNLPAENILIEYNPYDPAEVIHQKIGRLGRFGITRENSRLTYCVYEVPPLRTKKIINKKQKVKYSFSKANKIKLKELGLWEYFNNTPAHLLPIIDKDNIIFWCTKYNYKNTKKLINAYNFEATPQVLETMQGYLDEEDKLRNLLNSYIGERPYLKKEQK